jgi:RNA polymerase sigma factor (sigma-70 family)
MTAEVSAEDLHAARLAAASLRRTLGFPHIEWGDLLGYAHVALLRVLPEWDEKKSQNKRDWLYHMVRHGILDQVRKTEGRYRGGAKTRVGERPQFCAYIDNRDTRPSDSPSAEGLVLEREMLEAVDRLPPRLKSIIRMRYFLEMTVQETGKALGVCQSRAFHLEQKAVALLRTELTTSSRRPEAIHEPEAAPDPALGFVLPRAA